jgi:phosphatidate cytidylyltransferase
MAFNVQTFKTRALTAIIFVVVMLAGLLLSRWGFLALFTIIHFGCWREYQKLVGLIDQDYVKINPFHKYGIMIAGYGLTLFLTEDWFVTGKVSLHSLGWMIGLVALLIIPVTELLFSKQINFKNIGYSLLGLLYISLSWALMMNIRSEGFAMKGQFVFADFGAIIPCLIIFSIWINDTMAYIVGSLIGKTPLSKISPKKTWEGTAGGAILAVVVMSLIAWWMNIEIFQTACIAAIAAVTGTIGDLLESKLKRMANVKDSGSFMPGHGGFLDRFDSLLLATPFVWLFLKIIS